ncbi:MAG TPA: serine/threonine-protein kinase [Gemmatimonadales bacterium]|nr:serine/threonine-protein kinase [Gemmatimonadales bacterium]
MTRDLLPMVRKTLAGRYAVEREIGRGGAARVFLAQDSAGAQVAVKVLHPQLAASVTADRFLREIRLVAKVVHPRIARLLDVGEGDWLLWYVMEYIPGPTLRQHLDRVRRASISDTILIARDMLGGLSAAHAQGIVHRDVKPDNIVLSPDGAVLVDFGIAKAVAAAGSDRLTRSGFAVGTSAYMSPEQISGSDNIDARSDLYSLGCVLFECLAGRPPFDDPFEDRVLTKHQTADVPDLLKLRADTPPALVAVITRALAKAPEDRWANADEMLAALPALTPA